MKLKFIAAFLFAASTLLFGGFAFAQTTGVAIGTTTLVNYSNHFHKMIVGSTPNDLTVYIGRSDKGCLTKSNTSTCDSCADYGTQAITGQFYCNRNEIHDNLLFTVTLNSSSASAYPANCVDQAILARDNSTTTTTFIKPLPGTQSPSTNAALGSNVSASFTWKQLFDAMNLTSTTSFRDKVIEFGFNKDCTGNSIVDIGLRLKINYRYLSGATGAMNFPCDGVSLQPAKYEGICNYRAFRGDEKVYLDLISAPIKSSESEPFYVSATSDASGNTQDASYMTYDKLRVFCRAGNGNFSSITVSDICADLQISGTNLSDAKIEGLTNGVQYEFLAANVDQAGNVTYFSDPQTVGTLGIATPEPVNGLLDGKKCFIATAAFGSEMDPHVERFRNFRDQILLKHAWGRAFVEFYYEYSPDAARFIANNELLRTITRIFLYPLLGFCEMILRFGFLFPVFGLLFLFGVYRAQKRMKREKI